MFVVDVSRSMLASAAAGRPTRLERARAIVAELRAAAARRAGGHLRAHRPRCFRTSSRRSTPTCSPRRSQRSVADRRAAAAGRLDRRDELRAARRPSARNGFFTPGVDTRTCVLVTDGETRSASEVVAGRRRAAAGWSSSGSGRRRPDLHARRQGRRRLPPGALGRRGRGPARRARGGQRFRGGRPRRRARRRPAGGRAGAEPDDRHVDRPRASSRRTSPGSRSRSCSFSVLSGLVPERAQAVAHSRSAAVRFRPGRSG